MKFRQSKIGRWCTEQPLLVLPPRKVVNPAHEFRGGFAEQRQKFHRPLPERPPQSTGFQGAATVRAVLVDGLVPKRVSATEIVGLKVLAAHLLLNLLLLPLFLPLLLLLLLSGLLCFRVRSIPPIRVAKCLEHGGKRRGADFVKLEKNGHRFEGWRCSGPRGQGVEATSTSVIRCHYVEASRDPEDLSNERLALQLHAGPYE